MRRRIQELAEASVAEIDRQTGRQADRQTDRQADRQTDRQRGRDREIERETERERGTERQGEAGRYTPQTTTVGRLARESRCFLAQCFRQLVTHASLFTRRTWRMRVRVS